MIFVGKQRCAVIMKLSVALCHLCCHFGVKTDQQYFKR